MKQRGRTLGLEFLTALVLSWSLGAPFVLATPGQEQSTPRPPRSGETKLTAGDGEVFDEFGTSVSLGDSTLVVGAAGDDDNGIDSGSAYVFVRQREAWVERAKLLASQGTAGDAFGETVALSEDERTILIGAVGGSATNDAVHVFERDGGDWSNTQIIEPPREESGGFGGALSLEGDTALIGARIDSTAGTFAGTVWVFVRDGNTWTLQAQLLAPDGEPFDNFGTSVSISGDRALIGAPGVFDNRGLLTGAGYVFVRRNGLWSFQAKIFASDGEFFDSYGSAVAIEGDTAIVTAPGDNNENGVNAGAAYVITQRGTSWEETAKLVASNGVASDLFGSSVDLSGSMALVGSEWTPLGEGGEGAAYLFAPGQEGNWFERGKIGASDGEPLDRFGHAVSLSSSRALIGAIWSDDGQFLPSLGSAYVYELGLDLSIEGACPGTVQVEISNAVPDSEVGVVAAANSNGSALGQGACSGTALEIGEPFQLPPVWISVDGAGNGSGRLILESGRCWVEALATANCQTSGAVLVP